MRCLERNKSHFYYADYAESEPIIDEYGNLTGEKKIIRSSPQPLSGNISAAKGETETRQFGESEAYDKVIVLDKCAPPIDEYSVLWVDRMPLLNEDGTLAADEQGDIITPHDYTVKRVARSLNSVSIAIGKVNVGG